jgi:ABC-2 type transport system permease protein
MNVSAKPSLWRRSAKYFHVARITWKSMIAYRFDTWLGAGLTGFRVLLAFLLWTAVYNGRAEVGGYTLPMMVTYALFSTILTRLQHQDAVAVQLANEVREGAFSKYLVHPISVVGYFMSAGLGRWSYLVIVNAAGLALWGGIFSHWLALPSSGQNLWLFLLVPLGALCMLLMNHMIALFSLKLLDVGGIMILKGSVIEFFSGALIPLQLLPTPVVAVLKFTPFYYVVYYPANLVLGKQTEPPLLAAAVLLVWIAVFYTIGQVWFLGARKYYEGVGI